MIFYNVNQILNNNNLHVIMYIKLDVHFLEQFYKKCWSEKHKLTRELCEPVWKVPATVGRKGGEALLRVGTK